MNIISSELYRSDLIKAVSEADLSPFNGKTIFITGVTGLICSAIADVLIAAKEEQGLDITVIGAGRSVERIKERFSDNAAAFEYDALMPACLPEGVDYIIHGAGNCSPELYVNNPVETMLGNISGVKNLLDYCRENNTKMVYISSSEVYGSKTEELPFSEDSYGYIDLDNIRNSYSESKRASEMLCRSYSKEYGVQVVMVRPGHIYGPTASKRDKRISSEFAYKAACGDDLIMLSAGLQKRSYCYCVDCAIQILTCLLKGERGEAYNVGSEEITSIRDMAGMMADAGDVGLIAKDPSKEELEAFNPMNNSSLDITKIKKMGYKQCFSVKEGIEHTVKILKEIK